MNIEEVNEFKDGRKSKSKNSMFILKKAEYYLNDSLRSEKKTNQIPP